MVETKDMAELMSEEIHPAEKDRFALEAEFGKGNVWDTDEVQKVFWIESFMAPCAFVTRKKDKLRGILTFQHNPRFYFDFQCKE